jgi:hypothetical protein
MDDPLLNHLMRSQWARPPEASVGPYEPLPVSKGMFIEHDPNRGSYSPGWLSRGVRDLGGDDDHWDPWAAVGNVGKGIAHGIHDMATLPNDVLKGQVAPKQMVQSDQGTFERNDPQWDERNTNFLLNMAGMGGAVAPRVENAAGMFAGRLSRTADHAALARAEADAAAGVSREKIWNDHGWFQGGDKKWRYEIDDSKAIPTQTKKLNNLYDGPNAGLTDAEFSASERAILGQDPPKRIGGAFDHAELYDAYPDLANMRFKKGDASYSGEHVPSQWGFPENLKVSDLGDRETFLHELQHAVQSREKFSPGSSPENVAFNMQFGDGPRGQFNAIKEGIKNRSTSFDIPPDIWIDANKIYKSAGGEVESRAIEARKNLTKSERQDRYPWRDYDVPESDMLFSNGDRKAAGAAVGSDQQGFTAYHGSPHQFDKFDMAKIGTGEGAQAFGHGLYFAENEGVAKSYRDTLSRDKNIDRAVSEYKVSDDFNHELATQHKKFAEQHGISVDEAMQIDSGTTADGMLDKYRNHIRKMDAYKKDAGHMYEVNINADPSHFVNYDLPIGSQSKKIQDAFTNSGHMHENIADLPGRDAIEKLHDRMGGKDEASKYLKDAGIPGISYFDQGSRTAGSGSRNHVVFDPEIIKIMRMYANGSPALTAAPLANSSQSNIDDILERYGLSAASNPQPRRAP